MRNDQTGAAEAAPQITPPNFPSELAGERYLLETATCRVWCLATGTLVRREWARGRGLPRLVFAADCRPQLGEVIKRGLAKLGVKVDDGKPRWPSIHGGSGIPHDAETFALGDLKAVPRGRPAKEPPPTYLEHLRRLNGDDFTMPAFVPIDPTLPE